MAWMHAWQGVEGGARIGCEVLQIAFTGAPGLRLRLWRADEVRYSADENMQGRDPLAVALRRGHTVSAPVS